MKKNIDLALKTVVSSGIKFGAGVGALPRGLVSSLQPNPDKNKKLIWEDTEVGV